METKTIPQVGQIWQNQSDKILYRIYGISDNTVWLENMQDKMRHGVNFAYFDHNEFMLYQDYNEPRTLQRFNLAMDLLNKRIANRKEHILRSQWLLDTNQNPDQATGIKQTVAKLQLQIDLFREIKQDLKAIYLPEKQQLNTGIDYQKIFNFFHENHNLTLLESEMQDIVHIVKNANSAHQPTDDETELSETEISNLARNQY